MTGSPADTRAVPRQISKDKWEEARAAEDPGAMHPCDDWHHEGCFCKGACSCHWEDAPAAPRFARLRRAYRVVRRTLKAIETDIPPTLAGLPHSAPRTRPVTLAVSLLGVLAEAMGVPAGAWVESRRWRKGEEFPHQIATMAMLTSTPGLTSSSRALRTALLAVADHDGQVFTMAEMALLLQMVHEVDFPFTVAVLNRMQVGQLPRNPEPNDELIEALAPLLARYMRSRVQAGDEPPSHECDDPDGCFWSNLFEEAEELAVLMERDPAAIAAARQAAGGMPTEGEMQGLLQSMGYGHQSMMAANAAAIGAARAVGLAGQGLRGDGQPLPEGNRLRDDARRPIGEVTARAWFPDDDAWNGGGLPEAADGAIWVRHGDEPPYVLVRFVLDEDLAWADPTGHIPRMAGGRTDHGGWRWAEEIEIAPPSPADDWNETALPTGTPGAVIDVCTGRDPQNRPLGIVRFEWSERGWACGDVTAEAVEAQHAGWRLIAGELAGPSGLGGGLLGALTKAEAEAALDDDDAWRTDELPGEGAKGAIWIRDEKPGGGRMVTRYKMEEGRWCGLSGLLDAAPCATDHDGWRWAA